MMPPFRLPSTRPALTTLSCLALGASVCALSGCTHTLALSTDTAGASVVRIGQKDTAPLSLGKTPIVLDADAALGNVLVVTQEGREPVRLVVVGATSAAHQDVRIQLPAAVQTERAGASKEVSEPEVDATRLNRTLRELHALNQLVIEGKGVAADERAATLKERYARVAFFHAIVGNRRLLLKDVAGAREAYARALELDPEDEGVRAALDAVSKAD